MRGIGRMMQGDAAQKESAATWFETQSCALLLTMRSNVSPHPEEPRRSPEGAKAGVSKGEATGMHMNGQSLSDGP